jgi:hypothetical protein
MSIRCPALALVLLGFACGQEREPSQASSTKEPQGTGTLVGVWPEKWTCEHIATAETVGGLVGGTAEKQETQFPTPPGVAKPCNYVAVVDGFEQGWTFDLDCRPDYKRRADALFAQYTRTSGELVAAFRAAADARPIETRDVEPATDPQGPTPDAAPPRRAPEDAFEVAVGARALDHHGQGLLFIDDDAPCYVRVVGPSAERRLALAQHVAQKLTLATAPMTPRAAP